MEPKKYVQFRSNGRVVVYHDKKPPFGLGPYILVDERVKKAMLDVPYNEWSFKDGILSAKKRNRELVLETSYDENHQVFPVAAPPGQTLRKVLDQASTFAAGAAGGVISFLALHLLEKLF